MIDFQPLIIFNTSESIFQDITGTVLAYEIPPPDNVLQLSVVRLAGKTGRLILYWEADPITASLNDFSPLSGNITFQDGQVNGLIVLYLIKYMPSISH